MKVEKIIKQKDNKYKIIIDGETITTYDNVILENNLLYKKTIEKNVYKKILDDTKFYEVYNKVVKYILKKRRSEKEIIIYLKKYEMNDKSIEKIVSKLKDLKLINDREYCRAYINDKVYLSKNGINKIRMDLLEQDIPIEVIEEELSNIDNSILKERLEKIIIKKINSNKKHSNYHLKQKILNEMIMLGYSKEDILDIIEQHLKKDNSIIENEFSKLYLKLSKKLDGKELENVIKQKLLLKGFTSEEINEVIENQKI